MISKRAVRVFLERERQDYRNYKRMSRAELVREKDKLPIKPPIWKVLNKHQRACFLLGATKRFWGFFLDTGMGKTLLTIALGRYYKRLEGVKHILVLVPNKINKAEWAREMKKWGQRGNYIVLRGSSKNKRARLERTKAQFVIETYAGFIRMVCEPVPAKRGHKMKLKPVPKLVKALVEKFDGFVCDESTQVQSKSALAWRVLRQLRKKAKLGFILTGTPFGRDVTALWAQVWLLDHGYTLGETLGLFRAAFFSEKRNYWGGMIYTFQKRNQAKLNRFLANVTTRYEVDQGDLPKYVPIVEEVALPHDTQVYVDKARQMLIDARGNFTETKNAFLRMRQLSSGFIGYKDDDTGKRAEIEFTPNPKMEMLLSIVASIDTRYKLIVFHDFIYSGDMICRELSKAGFGWVRISGKTKDHSNILYRFDHDPQCRILVLNNRFSMGPNLQAARYGIWYEAPCSCILKKQGRRRFERQHSEHKKVVGYELVVQGTYDQRILDFHAEGKDLFEAVVNGEAQL